MTDDLVVNSEIVIPDDELQWTFSTSGGPGGQHANRSNTRAELRFDVAGSASIPDSLRGRVLEVLQKRLVGGVVLVTVDESRSQWRNRQMARKRLAELLDEAARPPAPPRRRTKPSRSARRRRLESKRRRGETKQLRKRPGVE
ncbi:MAG: alternative ribosome rescue aminoacyl-tRNA hydrolase ArfB [Acidimicrobiia bacterium]|nr:alternative ribosome rescue aminoacyl-tRNA hydrolase ArfB [Acidimicrobiia bacterium]